MWSSSVSRTTPISIASHENVGQYGHPNNSRYRSGFRRDASGDIRSDAALDKDREKRDKFGHKPDFGHLQVWADLVLGDGDIAAQAGKAVRHLMVDEFQDTSRIQLRILSRLSETHGNIVVVGDDDQSIYRFRGASVTNLLEFHRWFLGCRTVELATNYRSHRDIVAAVGRWMDTSADWDNEGQPLRYAKDILPAAPESHADYPAVIAVEGTGPGDEGLRVGGILRFLRANGVIAGYGQAVLLHSVKDAVSGPYLDGLELAGVRARCEPAGHSGMHVGDELLVTTIHQAKGREWDVVVVGSLGGPDLETNRVGRNLAEYCGTDAGEPGGAHRRL